MIHCAGIPREARRSCVWSQTACLGNHPADSISSLPEFAEGAAEGQGRRHGVARARTGLVHRSVPAGTTGDYPAVPRFWRGLTESTTTFDQHHDHGTPDEGRGEFLRLCRTVDWSPNPARFPLAIKWHRKWFRRSLPGPSCLVTWSHLETICSEFTQVYKESVNHDKLPINDP
jgi:hypothetical protein